MRWRRAHYITYHWGKAKWNGIAYSKIPKKRILTKRFSKWTCKENSYVRVSNFSPSLRLRTLKGHNASLSYFDVLCSFLFYLFLHLNLLLEENKRKLHSWIHICSVFIYVIQKATALRWILIKITFFKQEKYLFKYANVLLLQILRFQLNCDFHLKKNILNLEISYKLLPIWKHHSNWIEIHFLLPKLLTFMILDACSLKWKSIFWISSLLLTDSTRFYKIKFFKIMFSLPHAILISELYNFTKKQRNCICYASSRHTVQPNNCCWKI